MICKTCNLEGEFYESRRLVCKTCVKAETSAWAKANRGRLNAKIRVKYSKEHNFRKHIYTRYRLRPKRYEELIDSQGGKCALCERKFGPAKARIDHDHSCCPGVRTCGKCIRGVLCAGCNVGIGNLGDSVEGLEKALNYLKLARARFVAGPAPE